MVNVTDVSTVEELMRARFEASLSERTRRAERVRLQHFIPAHWFATAASECAKMFIGGYFYGCISVSQAYVEALSRFLTEHHHVRVGNDVAQRCTRLADAAIISAEALEACQSVLELRNDFHHLNKEVPIEYQKLQQLAENCINHLHTIESDVFGYALFSPGQVSPNRPEYWPETEPGKIVVYLRNLL